MEHQSLVDMVGQGVCGWLRCLVLLSFSENDSTSHMIVHGWEPYTFSVTSIQAITTLYQNKFEKNSQVATFLLVSSFSMCTMHLRWKHAT